MVAMLENITTMLSYGIMHLLADVVLLKEKTLTISLRAVSMGQSSSKTALNCESLTQVLR